MRVINYPDGSTLTSGALAPADINTSLQTVTCWMLGIDPTADPLAYSKVRLDWPTGGQPAWAIADDVCFLGATEADDEYNRIRDKNVVNNAAGGVDVIYTFVRCWRVNYLLYGPNAFDNARLIRSGFLQLGIVAAALAEVNLDLVTDIAASSRNPELYQGQWWERADLTVFLYELVTETLSAPIIASAEVKLFTPDQGQVADFTATTN